MPRTFVSHIAGLILLAATLGVVAYRPSMGTERIERLRLGTADVETLFVGNASEPDWSAANCAALVLAGAAAAAPNRAPPPGSGLDGSQPGFAAGFYSYAAGATAIQVAIGDLDGDARPDLAVANEWSHTVSVLRGASGPA